MAIDFNTLKQKAAEIRDEIRVRMNSAVRVGAAMLSIIEKTEEAFTLISTEETARKTADDNLQAKINNEAAARKGVDEALLQNINNEAAARQDADDALQTAINAAAFYPLLTADSMADLYDKLNDLSWWSDDLAHTDNKPWIRKIKVYNWTFTLTITKSDAYTQFLYGPVILNQDGTFNDAAYMESRILKRIISYNGDTVTPWRYTDCPDFINVDACKPLANGYYTPDTARQAIAHPLRKKGLVITYRTGASAWTTEQFYRGEPAGWTTPDNWRPLDTSVDLTDMEDNISVLQKTTFKHLAANADLDAITKPGAYYIGTQEVADDNITQAFPAKDFLLVAGAKAGFLPSEPYHDLTQYRISKDSISTRKHYAAWTVIGGTSGIARWDEWQKMEAPTISTAEGQEPKKIWVGASDDLPTADQRTGTKTLYITVENNE